MRRPGTNAPYKQKGSADAYFSRSRFSPLVRLRLSPFLRRSTTPRPSLSRSHSRSLLLFLARFFLSPYTRMHIRTHVHAIYAACSRVRAHAAPSSSSSSSSSSAPLGHTHKSKGKERGHGIFQDGIFNALARSVTPGEPGPRDWPASPRIPGPSLAEPGPRPTLMPSVLPTHAPVLRARERRRRAAPSNRAEPSRSTQCRACAMREHVCVLRRARDTS